MNKAAALTISRAELIVILGILTSLAPLSIDMYLPAFTAMETYFATDAMHVQLTLSSFFIAFASGQLLYGPLSDRYGRKRILYIGLTLFIVTSILCVFATSIEELIILRFFQALGASVGITIARAVVSDLFVAREAAQVYSAMILVMGAAPMLAPLIGGYLMAFFGWDSIFEALAFAGVLALLLAWFRLEETHGANETIDLSAGSVLRRYASLAGNRKYMGYTFAGGLGMSGMFAYISSSPFVFMDHFKISADHFGWFFGVNALGFIIAAQVNGRLLKYKTPLEIIKWAITLQLFASVLLLLQSFFADDLYAFMIPLFFQIACLGFLVPNMTALAMAHFTTNAGSASAFMGSLQFLMAGVVSMGVSSLHSDSPSTLAISLAFCTLGSWMIFQFFCKRHESREGN